MRDAYSHALRSNPRFQTAKATGQKVGPAFEVSGSAGDYGKTLALIAAGGLIIGFAGYCILKIATYPWGL